MVYHKQFSLAWMIVALCVLTLASSSQAAELPPFSQLLAECQRALRDFDEMEGEESSWAWMNLAQAQVINGDDAAGLKAAAAIKHDFSRNIALWLCVKEQARRGTFQGKLPDGLNPENLDLVWIEIAEVYAKAGDFENALVTIKNAPPSRGNTFRLVDFYREMANSQLRHKVPDDELLPILDQGLQLSKDVQGADRAVEKLTAFGEIALKCGAVERQLRSIELAVEVIQMREHIDDFRALALAWARIAQLQYAGGDKAASEESFNRAWALISQIVIIPLGNTGDRNREFRSDLVKATAIVAAFMKKCAFESESRQHFDSAVDIAEANEYQLGRNAGLWEIVESQTNCGDFAGAESTAKRLTNSYYLAWYLCSAAKRAFAEGKKSQMDAYCAKVPAIADSAKELSDKTSILTMLAVTYAECKEPSQAKLIFEQAIRVADTAEEREEAVGYYQRVALDQVKVGLLPEGYATIQAMGNSRWKLIPFTHLVRAVAMKNAGQK